jgi:hypothetical protein
MNELAATETDAPVDFRTDPSQHRHWKLDINGPVATLTMDVDERDGLRPGYRLKLNSYDLGVDIELHDDRERPVQWRARCHGNGGIAGNVGIVECSPTRWDPP